ncbi:MAG: winged helix-turn-helix domain-containing protein [Lachnospiraceae bacterium]|nr:winged helix-turn-helix domain-containing protein [Lachnospiraceae bacterium]
MSEVLSGVLKSGDFNKVTKIVDYLQDNGSITPKEAEKLVGKSAATTRRYMRLLVETGYVEMEGNTNSVLYKKADV